MYFPIIGFCLVVGTVFKAAFSENKSLNIAIFIFIAIFLGVFFTRTVYRNNDWKNINNFYTSAIDNAPDSAKNHKNMGVLHYTNKEYDKAVSELKMALKIYPDYPPVTYRDLVLNLDLSSKLNEGVNEKDILEEAIKVAGEGLKKYPDFYDLYHFRGEIKFKLGQVKEGIEDLSKAYEYHNKDITLRRVKRQKLFSDRGDMYYADKQFSKAAQDYKRFLELLDPQDRKFNVLLMIRYAELICDSSSEFYDPDLSIKLATQVESILKLSKITNDIISRKAIVVKAEAHKINGDRDVAKSIIDKGLEQYPEDPEMLKFLEAL